MILKMEQMTIKKTSDGSEMAKAVQPKKLSLAGVEE